MSVHHFPQRTDLTPGSQIEVEGLRIACRRAGEGLPLLLLHGFVGDSREWRRLIEDLSNEFYGGGVGRPWLRRFIGSARSVPPCRLRRLPR
jgi:pimeloyl-ACP methyl ester carboxylesterase